MEENKQAKIQQEQFEVQTTSGEIPTKKKQKLSIKDSIKKLPEKKPHLDFIAAVLTIPLLALTLYLNIANLRGKGTPTPTPAPTPITELHHANTITPRVITDVPQPTANTSTCIKDIGPISISYPAEEQTVVDNPLCIQIDYTAGNYCSVVWSYRINNSAWSDYSNNSVCLYNLPTGVNTFQLQVKSLASPSTQTLTRHFTYMSTTTPSPTPTGTIGSQQNGSGSVTPTPTLVPTVTP